ncbi:hypothetical protein MF4836_22410 [Pseudomonas sp. MF4836]|nr:hypothetical protein MF4836_22410 [Pseudomonas sp. MF4836]
MTLFGPRAAAADEAQAEIEPRAVQALEHMGSYLRSLRQFGIETQSSTDQVLEDGQTLEFRHRTELLAQRPDKLRVSVENQGAQRSLYYDGKSFTLFESRSGYFTRAPAPASIEQLLDQLSERYGIELPLADLFRWNADTTRQVGLTSALVIGSETLDGQRCAHYAFRQAEIDWQLWLREGDQPLPCRLVISRRDIAERPRHSVDFKWRLAAPITARSFRFDPPAGARAVPLQQLDQAAANQEQQP